MKQKKIAQKLVTAGEHIDVGTTSLSVIWPTRVQLAFMNPSVPQSCNPSASLNISNVAMQQCNNVLGSSTPANLNDASVVIHLRYGTFDALFPGDADTHVDSDIVSQPPVTRDTLELLKVPHHGSKTGMTDGFLSWISPNVKKDCINQLKSDSKKLSIINSKLIINGACPLAVISVGKNSYGHPAYESIGQLTSHGFTVERTDELGDIEVISDGRSWAVRTAKSGEK